MNYGTYDLNEIFPFRIYEVQPGDTLQGISKKLQIPLQDIKYINDFSEQFSDKDLKPEMVS